MIGERTRRNGATGTPSWVKGFIAAGIAALLLVGFLLANGHGPWQHTGVR